LGETFIGKAWNVVPLSEASSAAAAAATAAATLRDAEDVAEVIDDVEAATAEKIQWKEFISYHAGWRG